MANTKRELATSTLIKKFNSFKRDILMGITKKTSGKDILFATEFISTAGIEMGIDSKRLEKARLQILCTYIDVISENDILSDDIETALTDNLLSK